ncbi:hypothetical protein O1611_g1447 [Lasiodiplodia mahajangana]|uniref:Uncharacterized protein n=1 Tax=Lasiodiplodia mahajangana TaxID=1108764 RepID=A0ACC2JXN5_9PEZI|nr:hypothetical protein O1611_g1447 [Lasiodiplodia mahajangana]
MNPYEANPDKIPSTDRFADVPLNGRYFPQPTDFRPEEKHINSATSESLEYWSTVLTQCAELTRLYESDEGGRDVFALGSVIVKSSHLKINERDVFVQERIPGIGLDVAWQYISELQKASCKEQARQMLQKLRTITPPREINGRSYVVPDPEPVEHRGIQEIEKEIIFADNGNDTDISFMDNDVTKSNIIVDDDRIVGLVDWEMAGFFGWKTASTIHVQIRTPKRENFAVLDLAEEMLYNILFWNDLYDVK